MQKASEKLEAMHCEAISLYDEFIKTFSTWEYADGEDAAMENEDGYSGSNTAWKLYLEKTSNENLLTQYLADISDLNGIEIYLSLIHICFMHAVESGRIRSAEEAAGLDADCILVLGAGAVSYTHLDVYKRQLQWCRIS